MRQSVENYKIIADLPPGDFPAEGSSVGKKEIIHYAFADNAPTRTVLDIGFGTGHLGSLIKKNPETTHWQVDGIDGFYNNCCNVKLFDKSYYRNIWHGLAQDIPNKQLSDYDVICLFDVIEHLEPEPAKELLRHILSNLGDKSLFIISTPLFFWPQGHINEGDLEEHLIGVPAQSLLLLSPLKYYIDSTFLIGTFILSRKSLESLDFFEPTKDQNFNMEAGRRHLDALGILAKDTLVCAVPG